eukprot:CAMPEP_0183740894 /NCGR_PEP_ID=MMETSP0737-20130205/60768_1 /TAXON_ID=385413 /ORGANISM="Thalassiosira miniscula, Strain CCMP1093" /LENGTH=93 /DNA_ID=CAMNT_0025976065 /DNA_START=46 /DNA_END=324 /DNA_ORIENTATION=+
MIHNKMEAKKNRHGHHGSNHLDSMETEKTSKRKKKEKKKKRKKKEQQQHPHDEYEQPAITNRYPNNHENEFDIGDIVPPSAIASASDAVRPKD